VISDPLQNVTVSADGCETGVFLFDIDGTLMKSGGAGGIAFRRAFHLWSGVDPSGAQVPMAGRTDLEILRLTLDAVGLPYPTPRARRELVRIYLRLLAEELAVPNRAELCPGVSDLLRELALRPCAIGLVTGNIEPGARVKLRAAGIAERFAFGAYGSDHEDRDRLVPIAMRRLPNRNGGPVPPDRVWVIGDTLRDVQCARAAGVNVLAVGTGFEDQAALAASSPGRYLGNLSDTAAVLRLLGASPAH
jgi:phosphoglycolate phosphatase